jgi:hypothetical protein
VKTPPHYENDSFTRSKAYRTGEAVPRYLRGTAPALPEDYSRVARFALTWAGQAGLKQYERQVEKQHWAVPKRAASPIRTLCS